VNDCPERLARFDPAEWPLSPGLAWRAWRTERRGWLSARGWRTLDGTPYPDRRPDHPVLGDVIDQLNAEGAARRLPDVWADPAAGRDL